MIIWQKTAGTAISADLSVMIKASCAVTNRVFWRIVSIVKTQMNTTDIYTKRKWLSAFMMIFLFCTGMIQADILFMPELQVSPLLVNTERGTFGFGSDVSLFIGYAEDLRSEDIAAGGVKMTFDTSFYDSSGTSGIDGSWFYSGLLYNRSYSSTDKFPGTEWALGLAWFHNSIGPGVADYFGISFDSCLGFPLPLRNFSGEFDNSIDLLFSFDPSFSLLGMAPHYQGGLRILFDPGIGPVLFFLETKLLYYSASLNELVSGTFFAGCGAGIRFTLHTGKKKIDEKVIIDDTTSVVSDDSGTDGAVEDKSEKTDPDIEKFAVSTVGNKIYFYSIRFIAFSEELEPDAFLVLDRIAAVLEKRKDIGISISAYAEYQENPIEEFNLYTGRAKKIKNYLAGKGIDERRIKVSSIGQIIMDSDSGKNAPVILEIINDFAE